MPAHRNVTTDKRKNKTKKIQVPMQNGHPIRTNLQIQPPSKFPTQLFTEIEHTIFNFIGKQTNKI